MKRLCNLIIYIKLCQLNCLLICIMNDTEENWMKKTGFWHWECWLSSLFCKNLLNFIRIIENIIYSIYDPLGSKLLIILLIGVSHLQNHKFKYSFANTLNTCPFSLQIIITKKPFSALPKLRHFSHNLNDWENIW